MDHVLIWAQALALPPEEPPPTSLPLIALKRWLGGLTLSPSEAAPTGAGWLAFFAGLGVLLLVVLAVQGPVRAIRQFFDVPGHYRAARAALSRLKRSARMVAVLLGAAVLAWTAWQGRSFAVPERLTDLNLVRQTKSVGEIAVEQGTLAALTPLRDLCGLGDTLVLLIAAATLVFKLSADRWGAVAARPGSDDRFGLVEPPPWTTAAWGAAWVYVLYRVVSLVMEPSGLPAGGCLVVEAGVVPVLMLAADGLVLGWILLELRRASDEPPDGAYGLDVAAAVALMPGAMLACLAALPARYVAAAAALFERFQPPAPPPAAGPNQPAPMTLAAPPGDPTTWPHLDAIAGWLVPIQGASLVVVGLAGAAAWADLRGGAIAGYLRLLRAEGARLVLALLLAGAACGGLSGLAYLLLLSLPPQPWVLWAADSYAHYATLPVGLMLLATLVELADRALPIPAKPAVAEGEGGFQVVESDAAAPAPADA